jgi:cobalt-zinc-cadmium efflux system membrane fusion protein
MSNRKLLAAIAIAFACGVGTTAILSPRSSPGDTQPTTSGLEHATDSHGDEKAPILLTGDAVNIAGIRTAIVREEPIEERLILPGTVEVAPKYGAKVTPPAPGKVSQLLVNLGERVRAGQPIAVIESFEVAQARAAVRQADAAVSQAVASVSTARAELALAAAGVRQAESVYQQAQARLTAAQQALMRQRELAATGAFSQVPLQAAAQELIDAQSEMQEAERELAAHEAGLARAERLFAHQLVSKQELEQQRLHLEQDRIRVEKAKARLALARQRQAREQRIADSGLLTAREVQSAEADVRVAEGDVHIARQGVLRAQQEERKAGKVVAAALEGLRGAQSAAQAARLSLAALGTSDPAGIGGRLTVTAPISGIVSDRSASLGEAVERTSALYVIESLSTVMVMAHASEQDIPRIRPGNRVEVSIGAYPGRLFPGTVESVAGRIDEKTRTLPIRCLVQNPNGMIKPEMYVRVSLSSGSATRGLAVPRSALVEQGSETYVYVQTEAGFERRPVRIGRVDAKLAEIVSGLKAGERVVVDGVFVLKSEDAKGELKGHTD